jgi:membrane fusion protein, multidrug efflux system
LNRARKRLALGALALLAIVLAATAWWSAHGTPTAAPAATPASPVSVVDGLTVVQLAPAVQQRSGLVVANVGTADGVSSEATAFGVVQDMQPVIDWRARYVAAQAQSEAARTAWSAAQAELARTRKLYEDQQNLSLKALQAAQADEQRARAAAEAATSSQRALQAGALQQFGSVLAAWAAGAPGPMQQLVLRRSVLVGIALAPATGATPKALQVSLPQGPRFDATWVGTSVQADARLGAPLQTYLVKAALPTHANVVAYLPAAGGSGGVFVPLSAVIWYADQPWAYVRRDASHFARMPLLQSTETANGYIARAGIPAGAAVVTQGAGLLLSQEQTPPPGAPHCKDPECDD